MKTKEQTKNWRKKSYAVLKFVGFGKFCEVVLKQHVSLQNEMEGQLHPAMEMLSWLLDSV